MLISGGGCLFGEIGTSDARGRGSFKVRRFSARTLRWFTGFEARILYTGWETPITSLEFFDC
jgi:hypothetical protein